MPSEAGAGHLALNGDASQSNGGLRKDADSSIESKTKGAESSPLNGVGSFYKTTNSTTPIIDTTKDLSALVAQQMRATPDIIALEDENTTLTYHELDEKVTFLASRLRDHGVGRDKLVGVLLGRSANYVIACLAALRAGGAFLVLELAYPPNLLADVIDDAKPTVVITSTTQASQINADIPLILLDGVDIGPPNPQDSLREHSPLPADDDLERLAFVSYSSGTTGRPKGIANPHMAPVLSYELRFRLSDLGPGDRVACNVFFIWEILRPVSIYFQREVLSGNLILRLSSF
jgi:non-ribosomal peptide synthetase component F